MFGLSDTQKQEKKTEAAKREEWILKFWQENNIFEKTEGRGEKEFVFYDGPPFANGSPHYGHILAGTIKDAIPRYKVMNGFSLRRRWGWDCHGLPVENLTEKELGLKGKKEILDYGIEKFNEATRVNIMRDAGTWERQVPRLGRFVDMKNDYKTMDPTYTESVWWAFKNLYDKNLVYKGFKSMHLCPRCGTTLSNFEVNLGYQDISDISVYVKFELTDEPGTFLLAWTTTPWTLPGNVAIAVNKDVEYVKVTSDKKEFFILAKKRFEALKDKFNSFEIAESIKGKDLVGKKYKPVFDYYYNDESIKGRENAWKVYAADFVTEEDGTGVAHEAPAFGEDDLKLAQANNIPIIHHVGFDGRMKKDVLDFEGLFAKPKDEKKEDIDHTDTDVEVIKYLAHNGKLFAKEKITHSYPHCWRCDTPLLNYAADSWFVKVTDIKEKLVKENDTVHWVPENVGKYRFGNWLAEARDWAISRARFWGAPIPVWETEDGKNRVVLGSLEDFRKYSKKSGNKYFVMRHGEAENNVTDINSSSYKDEVHVTPKGIDQIKKTAEGLKGETFDLIFASDFVRAKETAEAFVKEIGFDADNIIYDERLREINLGDFAGKPNKDYHNSFSSIEEKFERCPPNGESLTDVKRRVMEFLYEIESKYKDKKILIVSHEYVFWMMWTGTFGWSNKMSAEDKAKKEEFIEKGEVRELPFVPLPHNRNFELDFHKPYIDEAELIDQKGNQLKRIPEVFDCWFESGSMPYAQDHYPFDKTSFDPEKNKGFPAHFIAEGMDQTRGWFYSLMVLGVELFGKSPYQNVIVNGIVLAEDGQKMSKRLQNYPDPMEIVDKYGADALRYYLLASPAVRGENLAFIEKGVDEVVKKHIGRLLNVCSFYELFAPIEFHAADAGDSYKMATKEKALKSENVLDKWILARLNQTISEVTEGFEKYELDRAVRPVATFVDDLSTWYLRRSRDRFKSEDVKDRDSALATTYFVLLEFSKVIAPIMPFVSECVYLKLKTKDGVESIHLEKWPEIVKNIDQKIIENMEVARNISSEVLKIRNVENIKVRQPLSKLEIQDDKLKNEQQLIELIKDEINVKEVIFNQQLEKGFLLDLEITAELKEEGQIREIVRAIQELRKEKDLKPSDKISVKIDAVSYIADAILRKQDEIKRVVGASILQVGSGELSGETNFQISIEKI